MIEIIGFMQQNSEASRQMEYYSLD